MIRLVILCAYLATCLNKENAQKLQKSTINPKLLTLVSPMTASSDIARGTGPELSTSKRSLYSSSAGPTTSSAFENNSDEKDEDSSDVPESDTLALEFGPKRHVLPSSQTTKENPVKLVIRYQMECIEETRVDADVIVQIKHKNWWIPTTQVQLVKDWALCVLMKSGIMTKEGVYKIDVALQRVPLRAREQIEKNIDSCLSTKAIPAPDIAFYYIKCFQRSKSKYSSVVSAFSV